MIQGTGERGRVTREDVERAIAAQELPAAPMPAAETVPITAVRAIIAERMLASSQQTAPVTLTMEVDATELVKMRTQLNEGLGEPLGLALSYNDILVKITAQVLREFPYMNARHADQAIQLLPDINIGLAVDTDRGLLVPVVRAADRLTLLQLAQALHPKIERASAGTSQPDDLTGGTFTITNLGALEVDAFTPIINPPEMAVLGVGQIVEKPVAIGGAVVLRQRLVLSLTFDHRWVDGAPAARFLRRLKALIERPYLFLVQNQTSSAAV
jgi:pyruvate dehydrogenase E2 component (dihydrolipoamide acetyltransferase)